MKYAIVGAGLLCIGFAGADVAWGWQPDETMPPRFDVDEYCKTVASVTGSYSATIDRSCFQMEQTAYNQVKSIWSSLPAAVHKQCTQVATVTGKGSYTILHSCIEMEIDAMRDNNRRQFTY